MRCDPVLLADFDSVADAAGLTRSAALRQLMQRAIDESRGLPSLFNVTDDKGTIISCRHGVVQQPGPLGAS